MIPSFENTFPSELILAVRFSNSVLEKLDKILKLNFSELPPLAVFIPKEYYASGQIIFRCVSSKTNNER